MLAVPLAQLVLVLVLVLVLPEPSTFVQAPTAAAGGRRVRGAAHVAVDAGAASGIIAAIHNLTEGPMTQSMAPALTAQKRNIRLQPYTCGCQSIAPADCPCVHHSPDPVCSQQHRQLLLKNDFSCKNASTCNNQDEGTPGHAPLRFSNNAIVFPGNTGTNFSGIHYRPSGDFCGSLKLRGDVYFSMELHAPSPGLTATTGPASVPPSVGYLLNRDTGWLTRFAWFERPDTNQTVVGLSLCRFPGDHCHASRSWWVAGGLPTRFHALSQMTADGETDSVLSPSGKVQYGCDCDAADQPLCLRQCNSSSPIQWQSSSTQETYANYDISVQSGSDATLSELTLSRQFTAVV